MYKRILVTLDGSRRAEAVLPHALEVAKRMGSTIVLLTVAVPRENHREGLLWSEEGSLQVGATLIRDQVEDARAYLARKARMVQEQGVPVEQVVRFGKAGSEIIRAVSEVGADIVAMATRSRHGLERLVFGSVAEYVLRDARVPVLLVAAK